MTQTNDICICGKPKGFHSNREGGACDFMKLQMHPGRKRMQPKPTTARGRRREAKRYA